MNSLKLRETMNQIYMREEMRKEIVVNVKRQTESGAYRWKRLRKAAAAAAVFVLFAGASIPIQAGIRYLVKDRLENIPKQELDALNQMYQDQDEIQADSFTREYSKEEITRMLQLEKAYQNGRFPKQTINITDSFRQIPDDSLSYDPDTGIFHLPDRMLTDEELLQIIDFQYTADYALAQGEAAQKAKKLQAEEESRLKEEIREKGGITEQEALQAAEMYLQAEYGLSAEGMEMDIFLYEPEPGVLICHVSYQTQDDTFIYCYGIDLNAKDGSLMDTSDASVRKVR